VEIVSQGILEWQKLRCYNRSMQNNARSLAALTNAELLLEVKALAAGEREATARLIASLAELDARELYLGEGFPSLFAYCTQCLHLSEHAAYNRIKSARAARQWPAVLDRLADGSLTPTTLRLLAPHLTAHNLQALLDAARHKSTREVEVIVAELSPQPDVRSVVRKLPPAATPTASLATPSAVTPALGLGTISTSAELSATAVAAAPPFQALASGAVAVTPGPRAAVAPLSPERFKVQFTVGRETRDKLRHAQDLMRHSIPTGDLAAIFDRALTLLVEHLERSKLASARRPREPRPTADASRHIPATVKREVWTRDGGRCAFVGAEGKCAERGFLEFHHVTPYALRVAHGLTVCRARGTSLRGVRAAKSPQSPPRASPGVPEREAGSR
jgi:hypothetical protein